MGKKVNYEITINNGKKNGKPFLYTYGQTKNIELYLNTQRAVICFSLATKKTIDDLITFKVKLFRDAYRKIYLMHALLYDSGIDVKKISIKIDDEIYYFDNNTENFPFMFSMIQKKKLDLNCEWKNAIYPILHLPKSRKDTDLRFCAMFSFLSAKQRSYRIDRFTNLWTAMNAYGNYLAKCYEKSLGEEFDLTEASNSALGDIKLYGKDGKIVDVLSLCIKRPLKIYSQKQTEALWDGYYEIQNALVKIKKEEYSELYIEAKKALEDGYELSEKYKNLEQCAERFGRPLYVFLMTDYPYHLRCSYLHGSYSTILFSAYNDYEIASLGVVNYFIENYLNEKLPEIFKKDFWSFAKYQEIKECMSIVGPVENGKNKYDKGLAKLNVKSFSN